MGTLFKSVPYRFLISLSGIDLGEDINQEGDLNRIKTQVPTLQKPNGFTYGKYYRNF